jgi:formamidopyrimidine-DNA glycosylase
VPELPEVESVKRSLEPEILKHRIKKAELFRRDVLVAPGDPHGGFSRQRSRSRASTPAATLAHDLLEGCTITEIRRRGKQLAIIATDKSGETHALGVQLGMSGAVEFTKTRDEPAEPPAHTHAQWTFAHGVMRFVDPRRFGGLRIFRSLADLETHINELGPDALHISARALTAALANAKRPIKAALLDQSLIAGVGNIYADEALFISRIHPATTASKLKPAHVDTLAQAIRDVLRDAIDAGGSTIRDYRSAAGAKGGYQSRHLVYGRPGKPCPRCGTTLRLMRLAQRATVWCPTCQPKRLPQVGGSTRKKPTST